ncbi:MAG: hypothetical protein J0I84_06525 [Terrimonas sp.]|nr:hypothetical protein [Terrimonas sp.]OJY82031.1 MAG: hypothetical protein BGP13_17765 [Sphingobacteriales bacterium 40-81]
MPIKIFAGLIVLICISCNTNRKKQVPKVLDNKKISIEKAVKRGEEDILEGLYKEIADTSEILKHFESGLQELYKSKDDSLAAISTFDNQNGNYYKSAAAHAKQITDSVLRINISILISSSIKKYDSITSRHDSLVKNIMQNEATLKDLHKVLKIAYTLPLIEKYQQDNLPDAQPIEGFSNRQHEIMQLADTLIKK